MAHINKIIVYIIIFWLDLHIEYLQWTIGNFQSPKTAFLYVLEIVILSLIINITHLVQTKN